MLQQEWGKEEELGQTSLTELICLKTYSSILSKFFFTSCKTRGHLSPNLNSTSIKFCSCANEVITDLSYSIDNYMKNNSLKRAKFII